MAHNYYLVNGDKGKAHSVLFEEENGLKRAYEDISMLDLKTMAIKEKDARSILRETNPNVDLSGDFYLVSFPHREEEIKTYAPVFDLDDYQTDFYLDSLRSFAEQRQWKKENKKRVVLDRTQELSDYVYRILNRALKGDTRYLTEYDAIISKGLKDLIKEYKTFFHGVRINNFINSRSHRIFSHLQNYTELRNLTISMMMHANGDDTAMRSLLNGRRFWNTEGLSPEINEDGQWVQSRLSDFMSDVPPVEYTYKRKK